MKTNYLACSSKDCRKTFRNQESLDKHLKEEHSDSESGLLIGYRCKRCGKVLGTKQCLKEHLYTHTGQKPYKCIETGCNKTFRQSSQLSYHKKVHEELKKMYPINTPATHQEKSLNRQNQFTENIQLFNTIKLPSISHPQVNVQLPNIFK